MKRNNLLIPILITLFVGLPSFVFAQTYEIYTYGSGNFLTAIFNGVKMLIDGGHIAGMIKILLVVGLIIGVLSPIMGFFSSRGGGFSVHGPETFLALIRTGIIAAIIVYVLMIPRANIAIIDRADPSQSQVVSDVPMVNVFIAHVSSRMGDVVGREVEDVMVPVDATRFRKNGVAVGAKYLNEILDIEPPGAPAQYGGVNNVSISAVLNEYFERCVFPNFAFISGSNSTEALGLRYLRESPHVLDDISNLGGPFRNPNLYFNVNFDESNPLTCATAPDQINYYWNSIFNNWLRQINYKVLGGNPDDPGHLATVQQIFDRYFPNSVGSFQDQIKQLAVLNGVRYAFISYAARHGDTSVKDTLMAQRAGAGWVQMGRLFNKVVHTMRMVIEGFVYGASVFLPVFAAIAGLGAFLTFVRINLWLQMWVPFYVILNAFTDWQFMKVIEDALYNPEMNPSFYGISFATVEAVRTQANLVLGYIGAFSWSVPALAWGLLKGGEFAVTHALSTISSGAGGQSVAQQVGADVGGSANLTMGKRDMGGYKFLSSTVLSSQASMTQGIIQAETMRRIASQTLAGGMSGFIDRAATGQAVDTMKQIGRGEVYGGDLGKALAVAGIGEKRAMSEAETFRAVANQYGGIESFQSAISARDFGRIGTVLGDYASRLGVPLGEAARQVGNLMGTQEFAGVMGLRSTLGVAGRGGLELSETQKLLGDVAKAEQMYQFARWAGYAGGREDFSGMYKGQLSGQAHQTWTLQDQGVVDRLNQMASDQGLGTRFGVGDRVSMAWTFGSGGELEKVTLARGESGAGRDIMDLTKTVRGLQSWSGTDIQQLNLGSAKGVLGLNQPGIFDASVFAALLKRSGAEGVARSLARDIAKGRGVTLESATFDPVNGKLTSFALQRGGSMEIEDYTKTQMGWESRRVALETWESGRKDTSYDVSQMVFERGPITSPSSMWSAAIKGDRVLGQRVYEAPTMANRNQEVQEQAVKFAEAAASRISKHGVLVSAAEYSASAGGKILLFGAEVSAGHRNLEQDNYNRIYGDIRRGQEELLGRLNRGEIKREEFEKQYSNLFQSYAKETDRLVKEKEDKKFGADSIVTRPLGIERSLGGGRTAGLSDEEMKRVVDEAEIARERLKGEDLPVGQ